MFDGIRREDMPWLLGAAAIALFALWAAGTLIGQAAFELKHPCVRRSAEARVCRGTTMECAVYDDNGNCMAWATEDYEYDCTPCVERKL